jgi:molecular chaperone DnaK (HSP70)
VAAIVGIDLGTTTTVAARFNEAGMPEVVTNWKGQAFIHSAFWFSKDNAYEPADIGDIARGLVGIEEGAFSQYKRDMGTDVRYEAHGRQYTPQKLTELMLERQLKHLKQEHHEVGSLAITVPANFLNKARQQTIQAAVDAGFPLPIRVIDEPTAAALYYVHTSPSPMEGTYLVYDFGGGTLDVSIMEVSGRDIQVKMSHGVARLGGMDLDKVLYDLIQAKFSAKTGEAFTVDDAGFSVVQAEAVKEQLSSLANRPIEIFSTKHGIVKLSITQDEFIAAAKSIFDQSIWCVEEALSLSHLGPKDIAGVFMAGGSSNIPELKRRLQVLFGFEPVRRNPSQAIALGAAIFAGYKAYTHLPTMLAPEQQAQVEDMNLVQSCPCFLGTTSTSVSGFDYNTIILRKGMPRPVSVTEIFYVMDDEQESIRCDVTQSEDDTQDLDHPGLTRLFDQDMPLPAGKKNGDELHVTFTYDENGVFKGTFLDPDSGETVDFEGNL